MMETVNIQWQSASGQWLVSPPDDDSWQPLAAWAENLPDLTPVRMLLSPVNYSTHWVSLPGGAARHIARALPFALEESLIEEVGHYLIVPGGQAAKKVRAYALAADLVERLMEECGLHHLLIRELIPQTQLLDSGNLFLRSWQNGVSGWMISLPGRFEGWIADGGMTAVLDSLFDGDDSSDIRLTVLAPQLDQAELLKTTLETSFPGKFTEIGCRPDNGHAAAVQRLSGKPVNLLVGQFQVRETQEKKPPVWWRPLAGLAAVWLAVATLWLLAEQHNTQQKADQVYSETLSLYKGLFPGERIRLLERQIREKISGGSVDRGEGFLAATNLLARVWAAAGMQKQIEMTSMRFNDRLQELVVEVKATNLNELQTLRQALEKEGLTAEVASATNDKDGVKGRLRIGGAA